MQPIPYLFFPGNCAEAMRFYARTFDAPEPEILTAEHMPEEARSSLPEGVDGVMHAALKLGEGWLFASDNMDGGTQPAMAGASIHLSFPTPERAHRVFGALSEGGSVNMPIAETFWAPAFGTLVDRFGTRWMISADGPQGQQQ